MPVMNTKELEKIQLMALVGGDVIEKSDAIVCLEGDGYNRLDWTIKLFQEGLADKIVVSGGYNNPPFSIPAEKMAERLIKRGIPPERIILEKKSQQTREHAVEIMKVGKEKNWKNIILVASHFHQARAYLTFLKAMEDAKSKVYIFNAPVKNMPWFKKTNVGLTRFQLLIKEFKKIGDYIKKDHLVSIKKAIEYQKFKEEKHETK